MNQPTNSSTNDLERRAKLIAERNAYRKEVLASPEGQKMVQEKIDEIRGELALIMADYESAKKSLATCLKDDIWIWEFNLDDAEKRLKETRAKLNRWLRLSTTGWRPVGERPSFDLEQIKSIPIGDLMPTPPSHQNDSRATYRCPVHNEKTASFVWFKDQNTFHCFGCQINGDVIDLYQKINECDFIHACRALTTS